MKLRLSIDDGIATRLLQRTGASSLEDVVHESLALLDYATEAVEQGGFILSIGEDGANPVRYSSPGLEAIRAE